MRILAFTIGHDSSVCVLDNGALTFYSMSERITRQKHEWNPIEILKTFIEKNDISFDIISIAYFLDKGTHYLNSKFIPFINDHFKFRSLRIHHDKHHLFHAYGSLHNLGLSEATIVVLDGAGEVNYDISPISEPARETESIFYLDFNTNNRKIIRKRYWHNLDANISEEYFSLSNNLSVGWKFEKACQEIGFGLYDAGKVMGLSQYKDNKDLCDERWQKYINFCSSIQKNTEEQAIEIIQYAIDNSESENIVVTGGYALNCVANKKYIEHFSNINLHIDPICFDGGISIGLAVYEYKNHDIPFYVNPLEQIYLGNNYNTQVKTKTESIKNIVKHICNGEIIAVFQGRSEAGQRALGNRSIVFDPRNPQGKDIVNKHKQRESFRPFAASILQEDCEEWFDMCGLKSSPYMMYALECKQPDKVPAVIHVDGTSRIQTVSQQQNKNFYKLIKEFKNQTSIPMLLNTSFNCAGDPLVETIEDAIESCSKMGIKKLYLLDTKKLILI